MFRLLTLVLAITLATPAAAEPVSSIRQAAIERLEQKLGTMRGTIKRKQRRIYLTRTMVERFKPLDGRETFARRLARLKREENPQPLQTIAGDRRVEVDGVSMAEIYAIAGIEEVAGGGKGVALADAVGLDSANLDDIIAGVDALIAAQTNAPLPLAKTPPPLPAVQNID
ncbi:MAG: hypothetical protein AAFQ10_06305 [Pseudomonadota bacterium]